jgi:hypothetical protein
MAELRRAPTIVAHPIDLYLDLGPAFDFLMKRLSTVLILLVHSVEIIFWNRLYLHWNMHTTESQNVSLHVSAFLGCHHQGIFTVCTVVHSKWSDACSTATHLQTAWWWHPRSAETCTTRFCDSLWIKRTDALNSNFIVYDSACFVQPFCPSSGVLSWCTAKNSRWWAERLPETCRVVTNTVEIQYICWFYSQGICHDARSYDLKICDSVLCVSIFQCM